VGLAASKRFGAALMGLLVFPGDRLSGRGVDPGRAEDMRMAADHLVGDRGGDVVEIERAAFFRHAGMEHDLKHQVAEFFLELCHGAALGGFGDFIGFLDGVGRDRGEVLLAVPWAAGFGIAQLGHDSEQALDRRLGVSARMPCNTAGGLGRFDGHDGLR
jgi:hypothetical protein